MDSTKTIRSRIATGYAAFGKLWKIWRDRNISIRLKMRLMSASAIYGSEGWIIPSAIYGSEGWILKKREREKLNVFEMYCMQRIVGVHWQDRITNEEVRHRAGIERTIVQRVEDNERCWFGHVCRMEGDRWPKKVFVGGVHGVRPRGRPQTTWWKQFRQANKTSSVAELFRMAEDRLAWKTYRAQSWDPTWQPPDGT